MNFLLDHLGWTIAIAFLIATFLFVWQGYRYSMNPIQFPLWILNWTLTRVLWRVKVRGRFPTELVRKGCVIVANHRSSADPMVLQAAVSYPIKWMIAKEYVESPGLGWLLKAIGVIGVKRSAVDRSSAKEAIKALQSGDWIGIFPEAKINITDDLLLPARTGVAMLALRAGVPIIPCYIENSPYNGSVYTIFFMRARVRVNIGEPIYFDKEPREELVDDPAKNDAPAISDSTTPEKSSRRNRPDPYAKATLAIMQAMAKLSPEPTFVPTVHTRVSGAVFNEAGDGSETG